jgi:hypothetical protein
MVVSMSKWAGHGAGIGMFGGPIGAGIGAAAGAGVGYWKDRRDSKKAARALRHARRVRH